MSVTKLLAISLGAILTNNFIFSQFLGICPFLGVSKKSDTAIGMGLAVTFVMGLASAFCYGVNIILVKLGLDYMQTVAFILVVASLVQFIEMFLKKSMPTLYTALGVYLRRARRGAAQRAERLQLHRIRGVRHHRRPWLPAGDLPVLHGARAPGVCRLSQGI